MIFLGLNKVYFIHEGIHVQNKDTINVHLDPNESTDSFGYAFFLYYCTYELMHGNLKTFNIL
jgi:hypothetical protein